MAMPAQRSRDPLRRQLGQVHAAPHAGGGIEVEHLLADRVGIGRVRRELEASATTLGDGCADIPGHIAHVVHGVVCAHGAGVLGLDELHLHLPEIHEGVMPTPPGRSAALKGHLVLLP